MSLPVFIGLCLYSCICCFFLDSCVFILCLYSCLCFYSCICGSAYTFGSVYIGLCVYMCVYLCACPCGPPSSVRLLSILLSPWLCHPGWCLWAKGALPLKPDLGPMLHFLQGCGSPVPCPVWSSCFRQRGHRAGVAGIGQKLIRKQNTQLSPLLREQPSPAQ